ncbi:MAG: hypothetical protein DIU71_18340, partial [Proteobacteria bacterium]
MTIHSDRRRFLKHALAGAAGAALPWQLFSTARADSRTAELSVSRLADDMLVISGAGGNGVGAGGFPRHLVGGGGGAADFPAIVGAGGPPAVG